MKFTSKLTMSDDEIGQLYKSGQSRKSISEMLGVSIATIGRAMKRVGVKPRHKNHHIQCAIKKKGEDYYDYAAMVEDYANGLSLPDVARKFGCTTPTVLRALIQAGVDTRSISDAKSLSVRGKKSIQNGYVFVNADKHSRKKEHAMIAETVLGRPLKAGECVHHINGNRADNRHTNLLICTIGYHSALHARMRKHPAWSHI